MKVTTPKEYDRVRVKDWSSFIQESKEEVETKLTPYQKFTAFYVAFILLALVYKVMR